MTNIHCVMESSSTNNPDDLAVKIVNALCDFRQAACQYHSSCCIWDSPCHWQCCIRDSPHWHMHSSRCRSLGCTETIYFLAIYISRSLSLLCYQASQAKLSLPKAAVLSALADLARPLIQYGLDNAYGHSFHDMNLASMVLLHGACTMYVPKPASTLTGYAISNDKFLSRFSKMDSDLHRPWLFMHFPENDHQSRMIPRRIASSWTWTSTLVGESTSWLSFQRAHRLFTSFKELRREALDSTFMQLRRSHNKERVDSWNKAEPLASLHKAHQDQVPANDLTRRFLEARDGPDYDWRRYKVECRNRHIWGQLLRSNLDWDWDPSSSLTRLFNLTE